MTAASEAARQYQVALEHERRGRTELAGVLSATSDLAAAAADTAQARVAMETAWLDHTYARPSRLKAP